MQEVVPEPFQHEMSDRIPVTILVIEIVGAERRRR